MTKNELIKKIAKLESINDQLVTEFETLDCLVRKIGFEGGLKTLKQAAMDLIKEENLEEPPEAM